MSARRIAVHARLAALALVVVVIARLLPEAVAAQAARPAESARVLVSNELPPMRGDRLRATLVSATYPPGGASAPHSHSCPLVGHGGWANFVRAMAVCLTAARMKSFDLARPI